MWLHDQREAFLSDIALASIMAALFGSELLGPYGVPGIWFQFGIGRVAVTVRLRNCHPATGFSVRADLGYRQDERSGGKSA